MTSSQPLLARTAFACAFASAVAVLFSIAASHILLALAIATLLISGQRLRMPPFWIPLALFLGATMVSLLFSGSPAEGRPQIRKIFVFLTLVVIYSTFRSVLDARRLVLCWSAIGAAAAGWGLAQFVQKISQAQFAGRSFYDFYVAERITGPMSHWMTFSGQLMIVLAMLAAFLFFSPLVRKQKVWLGLGILCAALVASALLLGLTRSIWLGCLGAILYLVWFWQRRLLLAIPVVLLVALFVSPSSVRIRLESMVRPRQQVDSNEHRIVCWRTGWEMVKAHPILGLGPEIVKRDFDKYVPSDIKRPLPEGWYGHLHSIYIHYAAERGIPAVLFLLWMLGKILWDFSRAAWRLPPGTGDDKFILHGAIAVVIAVMIAGFFELNLGDSEVLAMFLAAVACGYVAVEDAGHTETADV